MIDNRTKIEKTLEDLYFISSLARKYAEHIKNDKLVDKIISCTLNVEVFVRRNELDEN